MMPDFKQIYATRALQYDQMVSREDYEGNILPALGRIRPLANLNVIELGAGTGRLTRLLAPHVTQTIALDISPAMLNVARDRLNGGHILERTGSAAYIVADNRQMPIAPVLADIALAGWSLGHFVGWYPGEWKDQIGRALSEMERVLRPDGTIIILETLGTGQETPAPPKVHLAEYYQWLEIDHGFSSTWIRTDYQFASVTEADNLTRFFFGDELADRIRREKIVILPECTGIWWRTV